MRHPISICLLGGLFLAACSGADAPSGHTSSTPAAPATVPSAPAPVARENANDWRLGDSLISVMGQLQGKIVADLFAGDGYYTWKLLGAGARVLAIDDDPANIAALEARKKAAGIGDDRLIIRQSKPGVTGLKPNEADLALITREYSQLGDRPAWFAQMLKDVKAPHTFFMVNFLPSQSPMGPPLSQRMNFKTVMDELTEFGYQDVGVLYKKLPYRYIMFASIPPEYPDPAGQGTQ